jgi:hypothetical protein
VKQIIDVETRTGAKSIRQLSEASANYTKNGKKISRDTITKYSRFWKDVICESGRGRRGFQIISQKNYEERARVLEEVKETLTAAFNVLISRKITDAMNEGRQDITLAEINQVFEDVRREITRPKIGNLFNIDNKLWPKFLQEKHPDIWTLVKDEKPASMPKDILEQFEEYRKKELSAGSWEERSNQKETKKG